MSDDDYRAEAIETYTRYSDLKRRARSAAKGKEKRLPDYFTLDGKIRCKPATLIQTLAEDVGGDVDNLSPKARIVVEKRLERILRQYNVHPSWIPLIGRVMNEKKIKKWR